MKTIILYRLVREDGGVNITPEKPENDNYTTLTRLIASPGCYLTDGVNYFACIDTENPEQYTEINDQDGTEEKPFYYIPGETLTKAGSYYTDEEILCVAFKTMRVAREETLQELLGEYVAQVGGFEE